MVPSRERGRSALPPLGDNPWDVTVGYQRAGGHPPNPEMARRSQPEPQVWKALPASPSQFRLGEAGMPWSSSSWPGGEPAAYPQDDEPTSAAEPRRAFRGRAAPADMQSPLSESSQPLPRYEDSSRATELEALSAAMMTVDNGFENQWWYQGEREATHRFSDPGHPSSPQEQEQDNTLGWAVASCTATLVEPRAPPLGSDIISPMSEHLGSPASFNLTGELRCTGSTRSDEFHFPERLHQPFR